MNWDLWLSFKKEGFVKYSLHQIDILKPINFVSSTSWEANVTNPVAVYARKKTKKHIDTVNNTVLYTRNLRVHLQCSHHPCTHSHTDMLIR